MSEEEIFCFERDFARSLRCIPMAVRLKLDRCGIKLSLRQWNRFLLDDRNLLLKARCSMPSDVDSYRNLLIALVSERTGETATEVEPVDPALWEDWSQVPEMLRSYAADLSLAPPTSQRWGALTPLQRFALLKLTRDSHDNANFIPAMLEFRILDA